MPSSIPFLAVLAASLLLSITSSPSSSSSPAASSSSSPVNSSSSSSVQTIAISHVNNKTLFCALLPPSSPTSPPGSSYPLNCTAFPGGHQRSYLSGAAPYSGIAAGDDFLCALSHQPFSNTSIMRWWQFSAGAATPSSEGKRVYLGPALVALDSGDNHVCSLRGDTGGLLCWRWPELSALQGKKFSGIAVGGEFLCGLLIDGGTLKCFGDNSSGVVGSEPVGEFAVVAAGTTHACAVSISGELNCWGSGAPPERWKKTLHSSSIRSLALGENRTCVLQSDGTVLCDFELPDELTGVPFMAVQAKGSSFCGVLLANYSMVCWGSQAFDRVLMVYDRVLPGPCTVDDVSGCRCGVLPGSGNLCVDDGVICMPCTLKFTPLPPPPMTHKKEIGGLTLAAIVVPSIIVIVGGFFFIFMAVAKSRRHVHDSGRSNAPPSTSAAAARFDDIAGGLFSKGHSTTIEEFPLQLLQTITGGFSDDHRIGSGSFGTVYCATLDDGRDVAIKRAEAPATSTASSSAAAVAAGGGGAGTKQKDKEVAFLSELNLLSRVNHKNLVRLLGFCREGSERILVFEFMANGTLHDHLHKLPSSTSSPLSSWPARLTVALDAARGIEYLHTYAVPPIIHRDIKSSNILLDDRWTAKVADFGLSLMSTTSTTHRAAADEDDDDGGEKIFFEYQQKAALGVALPGGTRKNLSEGGGEERTAGTLGYMDPEYYRLQNLTEKSDVYSFGVVLLELLSGCRVIQRYEESNTPVNVVEFAVPRIAADNVVGMLDPRIPPPAPAEAEPVAYVGYLAADCVAAEGRNRPAMAEVVGALERAVAAISSAAAGAPPQAAAASSLSRSASRASTAWSM